MKSITLAGLALLALAGCGGSRPADRTADSTGRDIQLARGDSTAPLNDAATVRADSVVPPAAPAPSPAPPKRTTPAKPQPSTPAAAPAPAPAPVPAPPRAPARLDSGAVIVVASGKELSSRTNKAGETFTATIGAAVTAADGRVVIPAGAEVTLTIVALKPAPNKSAKDGTIELKVTGLTVNGQSRPIDAVVASVEHTLKGRGVTGSEAAKVGVGAAAGAVVGKVVGGKTGAVAGAVTGAAAGAAVAVETADRDVIIAAGAKIRIALRAPLEAGS